MTLRTCRLPRRTQLFQFTIRMEAYARARQLIDSAHAADPTRADDGRAAELIYGERVEAWVVRLVPDASPLLRLAARCQHLERWLTPRATFPEGKVGYLSWRRSLYVKQAERARDLLLAAGVAASEAAEVATWVSKTGLKTNPGTQALEDAAVLVFLENEISTFATQHADYPREKFVEILKKTWRKLSPAAQQAAVGLTLPPPIAELVRAALA
jgi:tRNAThr (cytosine32-N3)-methyltransferase